ncbi:MAG: RelA/SpoT family protein [bacterium JZ-2024 1]
MISATLAPEEVKYLRELKDIFHLLRSREVAVDEDLLLEGFYFSAEAHRGQKRYSGEPFISHPVAVVKILAEHSHADTETLLAGILHDTLEDTDVKKEPVTLVAHFGEEVFSLVRGVTKLKPAYFRGREELQAQTLKRFFFDALTDPRVLPIKMADRLHNLWTAEYLPSEAQRRKMAQDALDFYAPLSNRFGFYRLKTLVEDAALRILEPVTYAAIERKLNWFKKKNTARLEQLKRKMEDVIQSHFPGIPFQVMARFKEIPSIYRKMKKDGLSFEEIRDIYGLRVLVEGEENCYKILWLVHTTWEYIQGYFRDYIGSPKPNGYRSLHTLVMQQGGEPFEVQIRTFEMHQYAEYGYAAHWVYENPAFFARIRRDFSLMRDVLSSEVFTENPQYLMKALKQEAFASEIFAYTPKGEKIYLPQGSTVLDFAYKVHSEIGNRFSRGIVNGKAVPPDTVLHIGDVVEIITSPDAEPHPNWLSFVHTSTARKNIQDYLRKKEKQITALEGKKILETEIVQKGWHNLNLLRGDLVAQYCRENRFKDEFHLYRSILRGEVIPVEVVEGLYELHQKELKRMVEEERLPGVRTRLRLELPLSQVGLRIAVLPGDEDLPSSVLVQFCSKCYPLPGDSVIAVLAEKGKRVSLHRTECSMTLAGELPVRRAYWTRPTDLLFPVEIRMIAPNRRGLLRDVITLITDAGINILSNQIKLFRKDVGSLSFILEVHSAQQVEDLLKVLRKSLSDLIEVDRVLPP